MTRLSEILSNRMKELRLSAEQVADYCGVNKATVYRWLNGEVDNMRRANIASLSKILRLDPALIVGNLDEEDSTPVFLTAQQAVQYILEQPLVADFGGYDLDKMTDEQKINFATEVASMIQVMSKHYPRKDE